MGNSTSAPAPKKEEEKKPAVVEQKKETMYSGAGAVSSTRGPHALDVSTQITAAMNVPLVPKVHEIQRDCRPINSVQCAATSHLQSTVTGQWGDGTTNEMVIPNKEANVMLHSLYPGFAVGNNMTNTHKFDIHDERTCSLYKYGCGK